MGAASNGLLVVVLVCSFGSTNAVSDAKWRSPCGASVGSIVGLPGGPPTASTNVLLEDMLPVLRTAIAAAESLKNKYISDRFSERRIPHLNGYHCDGMPVVSMTTSEIEESLSDINLTHLSNYEKLSRVLIFLEQVRFDETFMDSREATYNDDVQEIERNILNVLCTKQRVIKNSGARIDYISHTVMAPDLRVTMNENERHERDYVIIKDTYHLLQTMHIHVTAINNRLRSSQ
ncbi:uncharacterized protein LOC110460107 isoform X2 [Mizuhopecten yessoensis]|uniref:uncharacterized protein LOC110460107 isoform X2 n=1 Tax=Mizuhopecten yessoensis TaxID=6573 RepID=UPI000B458E33|nr:uncharacterized protein LOC110460107 isoform X2 [Mizuhopecten yessoensis]